MPLTDIISHFSTAVADGTPAGYPVVRRGATTYTSGGIAVPGSTSNFTIDACVVPLESSHGGRERITLPNGVHTEDVRIIDTMTQLQPEPPDVIIIAGVNFAVFRVEGPVRIGGGARWTAYAARQVVP